MKIVKILCLALPLALLVSEPAAAHTDEYTSMEQKHVIHMSKRAIVAFKKTDPKLARFFENSAGYAVFPKVTKGAVGIGGAGGRGTLFEKNHHPVGLAHLSQVTIGVALGGQTFREIIFFETKADMDNFKYGGVKMSADASAVAAAEGAASHAAYRNGVAIFTLPIGGL
ncbi:MAG: hypothetical protein ACLFWF_15090, partial [Alphaproteobacteria bacterium]